MYEMAAGGIQGKSNRKERITKWKESAVREAKKGRAGLLLCQEGGNLWKGGRKVKERGVFTQRSAQWIC